MRSRRLAALPLLIGVLAAGPAAAQASFPPVRDADALGAWLQAAAGLDPSQVVAVTPSAVTAIVARGAPAEGRVDLTLRAEALTPEAADRAGVLAWQMRLSADCASGLVRTGETLGYANRAPDGAPVTMSPARPDWRRPAPGTALERAWRAACDAAFQPPLAPALVKASTGTARDVVAEAPSRRGPRLAQVVSSPVQADAERRIETLRARFGEQFAGLETRVETAQVRGRTVYRGLVAGFAGHDEAAAFCASLKRRGQDCLAR